MAWEWQVQQYLRSLTNPSHRKYAEQYLTYLRGQRYGFPTQKPELRHKAAAAQIRKRLEHLEQQ